MDGGGVGTSCLMGFGDNININRSSSGDNNNCIGSLCLPPTPVIYNNTVIFSTHDHHHSNCGASSSAMMLEDNNNGNINDGGGLAFISSSSCSSSVKAKIMSHPHYPRLLSAYLNCQKVCTYFLENPNASLFASNIFCVWLLDCSVGILYEETQKTFSYKIAFFILRGRWTWKKICD